MNNSFTPCHTANPELWTYFCSLTGRINYPADHWTEGDVIAAIRERILRNVGR